MSKKNDNDNIETINLAPRKGVIDLSFFDDLTDQLISDSALQQLIQL